MHHADIAIQKLKIITLFWPERTRWKQKKGI
uniref:Uncharacterized protein n=1 Tax=Anguilla anguilla TaxID=7936 RepID=A0A0E9VZR0_ANGAN